MRHAIGVDVGGSFVKVVAVDPDGRVIHRVRMPTATSSAAALCDPIVRAIDDVDATHGRADAVGVASPGLVRRGDGHVHWMQGRLDVVQRLNWTTALGRDSAVRVLNDAQAALVGEAWLGAGRGCADVVLLTIGTGVGGAAIVDGRLLTGHTGRAGHFGHMTVDAIGAPDIVGTPGSLEDAIGDCTVARRSEGRYRTTEALVGGLVAGEDAAQHVWSRSVQRLAAGITSIVNALDPSRVIVGGGIATRAGDLLMTPLRRCLDDVEWRPHGAAVEVVLAELGEEAGAIGAARFASEP